MILVLMSQGKNDSTDYVTIKKFDTYPQVNKFIKENDSGTVKHWTQCEIIDMDEKVELITPHTL